MYVIGKQFRFSASHQLPALPDGHPCSRLHGHNYVVQVSLASEGLIDPGFVTDFADLKPLKAYLDAAFDHRHLNDVMSVPPTSENLAALLAGWIAANLEPRIAGTLRNVRVSETDSSWAEYTVGAPQ
jgi:6-pyruvoyltetrahydropterin/6-carboxytetrahydropterin synthase